MLSNCKQRLSVTHDITLFSSRSALLRIMTREGCKYKSYVEDLERDKPSKPTLAPSSSLLDFSLGSSSSSAGPSKFDAFTRKFKDTMVDLINADLSQPLPSSSSSNSPYGATPRQQMSPQPQQHSQQQQSPQQPPRPQTPQQLRQQQQMQQQRGVGQQEHGGGPGGTAGMTASGGGPLGRQSAGLGNTATNAAGVYGTLAANLGAVVVLQL